MKTTFTVEPAGHVHACALAALHGQCFKDPWTAEAMSTLLATPGAIAFIASDPRTGEPVGFVLARIVADEGEILSIGVLGDARSRGVGAGLMAEVMGVTGLRALFLDVAADNENATRLYTRQGFDVVGRRSGYYARGDGARVDSLTMKWGLGSVPSGDKGSDSD